MKEVLTLSKSLLINGENVKELEYDFAEVTAEMFNEASAMASNVNGKSNMNVMELDGALHLYLGMYSIIAANPKIDIEDLKRVKGKDLIKIVRIGRNFITRSSEEDSEEESSGEQSEDTQESSTQESKK